MVSSATWARPSVSTRRGSNAAAVPSSAASWAATAEVPSQGRSRTRTSSSELRTRSPAKAVAAASTEVPGRPMGLPSAGQQAASEQQ